MEARLADAGEVTGPHYELGNFADMVEAIHAVQTQMGITGTTAEEAASTISGSVAMAKASWSNWLAGLGDQNADMGALTDQLIQSVQSVASNIGPRIAQIMSSVVSALPGLIGQAVSMVGQLVTTLGPSLLQAITVVVQQVPALIAQVATAISTSFGAIDPTTIAAGAQQFMTSLIQGLTTAVPILLPIILQVGLEVITGIVQSFAQNADQVVQGFVTLLEGINQAVAPVLPVLALAIAQLIISLVTALV